ncbi:MAG: ATP-binding protein, partial [Anaerolineales bacterium]|nr:ATP-binding protein [Anaerolineales bacterium]
MSKRVDLSSCGLPPSALLVVGVSGGADSLCLLHMLHAAGYPLIAAHFNHKLRPEADADAEAVRSVAKKMD